MTDAQHTETKPPHDQSACAVIYVLAYRAPDYIRTRTLIEAFRNTIKLERSVQLHVAVNKRRSLVRYADVFAAVVSILRDHPKATIILGFRGHEFYPLLRLLIPGRRIILDCMVSPTTSLTEEPGSFVKRLFGWVLYPIERLILSDSRLLLTDTNTHAKHISRVFRISARKIVSLPVGAVEHEAIRKQPTTTRTVLFYGSFLPLHGFDVILDALRLIENHGLCFCFIGARNMHQCAIAEVRRQRPDIELVSIKFIPFQRLLEEHISSAWLMLGGPFGGTPQAMRVITGKASQALALGIPSIIGINRETSVFSDRIDCLLVPQRDPVALANALTWAVENESRLAEIGYNGQRIYKKHLSVAAAERQIRERVMPSVCKSALGKT